MMKIVTLLFAILTYCSVSAQRPPEGLDATQTRAWIKANYYTGHHSELSYSEARKKMFAYASNDDGFIECFYSGLRQAHAYGLEISFPDPFNTEHIVPQSLFNGDDPMRADMHILQPCFDRWNNLRSNYEFQELEDINETEQWIIQDQSTTVVPTQDIDLYSEYRSFGWEPREGKKGDVARAFMYFFTMYPQYGEMDGWIDTSTLCQWHEEDTVDTKELFKSDTSATFQGNVNPFVSYPWFANQAFGCSVPGPPVVNGLDMLTEDWVRVFPNPSSGRLNIEMLQTQEFPVIIEMVGVDGKVSQNEIINGPNTILETHLTAGHYYLIFKTVDETVIGFTSMTIIE